MGAGNLGMTPQPYSACMQQDKTTRVSLHQDGGNSTSDNEGSMQEQLHLNMHKFAHCDVASAVTVMGMEMEMKMGEGVRQAEGEGNARPIVVLPAHRIVRQDGAESQRNFAQNHDY